jgi:hypothetical protein
MGKFDRFIVNLKRERILRPENIPSSNNFEKNPK